ncbi:hypothetical protein [Catenulispora pinistramenti]|uniref:hypothetical protein n=1 Tax=Catenulispora pinistramenti TaxID=2705254 RepID=UPI001E41B05B|nr:hypothetical protein [Catenulispora pinistramenti]
MLGSRTGGALAEEEPAEAAAAVDALEPDADGEEDDPAADFEDELEQPVRERAAATTATAAVVKEGRYLTMTPLVSCWGKEFSSAYDLKKTGQSVDVGGVRP